MGTRTSFPFATGAGANVSETQWGQMARLWLSTGVFYGYLNALQVYGDSTGLQVKAKSGQAWVEGFFFQDDGVGGDTVLSIAAADPTNPRIDLVVLRLDHVAESVAYVVLTGTPGGSPVAPTPTQTIGGRWELPLATVAVAANASTIAAGNVTDQRAYFHARYDAPGVVPGATLSAALALPGYTTHIDGFAGRDEYGTPGQAMSRRFTIGNVQYLTWNAYFDGTNWQRDDTGKSSWMHQFPANPTAFYDTWKLYRTAAGAGVITWTELLDIDGNGKLTGAGYYDSGEVAVLNGNTATVSHGLPNRPRFVAAYINTTTGSADTKLTPVTGQVGFPSATQLNWANALGGTRYINFYAQL